MLPTPASSDWSSSSDLIAHAAGADLGEEPPAACLERVGPEPVEPLRGLVGAHELDLPELARVAKDDFGAGVVEAHAQVRVLVGPERGELRFGRERGPARGCQQPHARRARAEDLAGHAEVEQQPLAVVEARDEILADAVERLEPAPAQPALERGGRRQEEVARHGREDARDAAADQQRLELPPRDLDFRQLRHGSSG